MLPVSALVGKMAKRPERESPIASGDMKSEPNAKDRSLMISAFIFRVASFREEELLAMSSA